MTGGTKHRCVQLARCLRLAAMLRNGPMHYSKIKQQETGSLRQVYRDLNALTAFGWVVRDERPGYYRLTARIVA